MIERVNRLVKPFQILSDWQLFEEEQQYLIEISRGNMRIALNYIKKGGNLILKHTILQGNRDYLRGVQRILVVW